MNLSGAVSTTTVEFDKKYPADTVFFRNNGVDLPASGKEMLRVQAHLDRIRKLAGLGIRAKVVTTNDFPKGTGIIISTGQSSAPTYLAKC